MQAVDGWIVAPLGICQIATEAELPLARLHARDGVNAC